MMGKHTPGPWEVVPLTEYAAEYGLRNCTAWGDEPEGIANARLIAAAPDMLAALEAVRVADKAGTTHDFRVVRDAIAKATGETGT